MKVLIIGNSGHWAYCLNELKNHSVVAVIKGYEEEDMSSLYAALENNGIEYSVAESFDGALERNPEIAVINTRFDKNGRYTLECLRRNIYVFSEKPLATDFDTLEKIKSVKTDAFAAAMFGISYEPWCETLKKYVSRVGDVRMINCRKSYKLGTRPEFYGHKEFFGGIIPWVGIHALHWIYSVTGLKFKKMISAVNNGFNSGYGDLETAAAAVFEMENGCIATVTADYFRPASAKTHDDDRMRIVGTKGILEYMCGKVTLIDENGEQKLNLEETKDIFNLFVKRITDKISGISQEESIYITEVALMCDKERM